LCARAACGPNKPLLTAAARTLVKAFSKKVEMASQEGLAAHLVVKTALKAAGVEFISANVAVPG
jgi:hypothetical protein